VESGSGQESQPAGRAYDALRVSSSRWSKLASGRPAFVCNSVHSPRPVVRCLCIKELRARVSPRQVSDGGSMGASGYRRPTVPTAGSVVSSMLSKLLSY
jgi:hypothetical protein